MAELSEVALLVGLSCCRRGVAKEFSKGCVCHNGIGARRDSIVLREGLQCGILDTSKRISLQLSLPVRVCAVFHRIRRRRFVPMVRNQVALW
jgi:hypothetical protein